jgi:hypothetical protein
MIGSGAFIENNDNYKKIRKVQSWTSNFAAGDIPHRHGIFMGAVNRNN